MKRWSKLQNGSTTFWIRNWICRSIVLCTVMMVFAVRNMFQGTLLRYLEKLSLIFRKITQFLYSSPTKNEKNAFGVPLAKFPKLWRNI